MLKRTKKHYTVLERIPADLLKQLVKGKASPFEASEAELCYSKALAEIYLAGKLVYTSEHYLSPAKWNSFPLLFDEAQNNCSIFQSWTEENKHRDLYHYRTTKLDSNGDIIGQTFHFYYK